MAKDALLKLIVLITHTPKLGRKQNARAGGRLKLGKAARITHAFAWFIAAGVNPQHTLLRLGSNQSLLDSSQGKAGLRELVDAGVRRGQHVVGALRVAVAGKEEDDAAVAGIDDVRRRSDGVQDGLFGGVAVGERNDLIMLGGEFFIQQLYIAFGLTQHRSR